MQLEAHKSEKLGIVLASYMYLSTRLGIGPGDEARQLHVHVYGLGKKCTTLNRWEQGLGMTLGAM